MVPVSRYWVKLRCRCFRFPDFCSIPHKKKFQKFLNSRTSDDFDMKLGPVPKLDRRNKTTSKKIDDDIMSEYCDVIVIFQIFCQYGAVWRLDSGHRVQKLFLVMVTFCLTEAENRTKKSLTQLSHYCFE